MATESLRAIDSNVVLRYLLRDDTEQWERATRLIDSHTPLGLTAVALAEIAWTLAGPRYRRDRAMVATQLIDLLATQVSDGVYILIPRRLILEQREDPHLYDLLVQPPRQVVR